MDDCTNLLLEQKATVAIYSIEPYANNLDCIKEGSSFHTFIAKLVGKSSNAVPLYRCPRMKKERKPAYFETCYHQRSGITAYQTEHAPRISSWRSGHGHGNIGGDINTMYVIQHPVKNYGLVGGLFRSRVQWTIRPSAEPDAAISAFRSDLLSGRLIGSEALLI